MNAAAGGTALVGRLVPESALETDEAGRSVVHRDSHRDAARGADRRPVILVFRRIRLSHAVQRSLIPRLGCPPPDGVTCTGMSTRTDGGTRGLALVTEEDDWFATPQQQGVELEVLPWDDELEWELRDPSSRDLGRRQAAIVLAVVVAILLVAAGILIGRATKDATTNVVTTTAAESQSTTAATTPDSNSAATNTPTQTTGSESATTTNTPSASTETPAASTPASNAVPTATVLQSGSKGAGVTALQNALTTLGYVPGAADGTYGATTAQAVKAFQTANGLTADGIAAAGTIASINTALANSTSASTETGTPDANSVPTDAKLQLGSKGADVIALQKALTTLGYPAGAADGTYGATTTQAVKAFQTAKNLTADGIAGAATLAAINAALASG